MNAEPIKLVRKFVTRDGVILTGVLPDGSHQIYCHDNWGFHRLLGPGQGLQSKWEGLISADDRSKAKSLLAQTCEMRILTFSDRNMAGDSWHWHFYLEGNEDIGYTLTGEQLVEGEPRTTQSNEGFPRGAFTACEQVGSDEAPLLIESAAGLRNGADVYEALQRILFELGYSLEDFEVSKIVAEIAKLNAALADEFEQGPQILELRHEAAVAQREATHRPYREIVEKYVLRFSDEPLRWPGGGSYGTPRLWARRFIEQYIVDHGQLPDGKHRIEVRGYCGPEHDFSDLKAATVRDQHP